MNSNGLLRIGGIIESPNIALVRLLGMPDRAGAAGAAVRIFAEAGVNIEFISESSDSGGTANLAVGISMSDIDRLEERMHALRRETGASTVTVGPGCALIGLHGQHFGEIPGVASRLFSAVGSSGVNILAIASSLSSMCCVVHDEDRARARAAIIDVFGSNP